MGLHRYIWGIAGLVAVLGPLGLGASTLRAMLLPDWRGGLARLAEVVMVFTLVTLICEVLGTLRIFRMVPVVVVSIMAGVGLWRWSRPRTGRVRSPSADASHPALRAVTLAVALLASGVILTEWAGPTLRAYNHGILGLDSLWYHMPWAAWYAQSGKSPPFI